MRVGLKMSSHLHSFGSEIFEIVVRKVGTGTEALSLIYDDSNAQLFRGCLGKRFDISTAYLHFEFVAARRDDVSFIHAEWFKIFQ